MDETQRPESGWAAVLNVLTNRAVSVLVAVVMVLAATWAVDALADHSSLFTVQPWLRNLIQGVIALDGFVIAFLFGRIGYARKRKADALAEDHDHRGEAAFAEMDERRSWQLVGHAVGAMVFLVVGPPVIAALGTWLTGIPTM